MNLVLRISRDAGALVGVFLFGMWLTWPDSPTIRPDFPSIANSSRFRSTGAVDPARMPETADVSKVRRDDRSFRARVGTAGATAGAATLAARLRPIDGLGRQSYGTATCTPLS